MKTKKVISIICPVFNEEKTIPIFYDRIKKAIASFTDKYQFELLFCNNSSTDGSLDILLSLSKTDPIVNVLTLARNFGYQRSIFAGLNNVTGDATVIIDADCEDPPEMMPEFIELWEKGYDIVYGLRDKRNEPKIIEYSRKLFYRFLKLIADNDTILDMAEFSLFTRRVREVVISINNNFPFIRNEIAYVGFKRIGIRYDRELRAAGKTSYNLFGMFKFAVAGILTSSTFPLRLTMYTSIPVFLINLIFVVLNFLGINQKFFESIVLLDLMFLIFAIPFISIYLARIFHGVILRPVFIIDMEKSILKNKTE